MYNNAMRATWNDMRSLGFASISGTYAGIGSALTNPCRIIKIVNTTDADITISDNGIRDVDIVPAGSFTLYDLTTNSNMYIDLGTRLYAKGSPTSGSVYVVSLYASSN